MKHLALVSLLALIAAIGGGGTPISDCYLTPQSTVANYWHRMLERRHREALECFVGKSADASGMFGLPSVVELHCRNFQVTWHDEGVADVCYDVVYRINMGDSLQHFPTGDQLELTGGGWKIAHPMFLAGRGR